METSEQVAIETSSQVKRRRRSVEEKRQIVEEKLEAGASVARVARRHAVNANQVFYWRKKYREGRLGKSQSNKLLPVTLSDIPWNRSGRASGASSPSAVGSMEIKLANGTVRVAGNVDVVVLRTAIECLLHAVDTPVPVLAPGLGKTKTGRLWTYVRDDRPAGERAPAAVWFAYSPDRKGEHPQ